MDIMELGAIGELVGAVAVIGSLVFVGLQVRQNTSALAAQSREAMSGRTIDWLMQIASDADCARIFRVGQANSPDLDADATLRFQMMMYAVAESWEAAFSRTRSSEQPSGHDSSPRCDRAPIGKRLLLYHYENIT